MATMYFPSIIHINGGNNKEHNELDNGETLFTYKDLNNQSELSFLHNMKIWHDDADYERSDRKLDK